MAPEKVAQHCARKEFRTERMAQVAKFARKLKMQILNVQRVRKFGTKIKNAKM